MASSHPPEGGPDLGDFAKIAESEKPQDIDDFSRIEDLCYGSIAEKLDLANESFRQDIAERKDYAKHIFRLIIGWLSGVALILILQGFGGIYYDSRLYDFRLSDKVLITLISGTTINVLGIFIKVAKYLFRQEGVKNQQ